MEETKIQSILGVLKSVPGFNPGAISDEALVQLVYPLFQKPKMSKNEALENTRIVLGIKPPVVNPYQEVKEEKDILLTLTGSEAIYGSEKEDEIEKLNNNINLINNSNGNVNPYCGGNYNPGIDNLIINDFIAKYKNEYTSKDRNKKFIIDPPDLLRKKTFKHTLISSEMMEKGFRLEGRKDEYDYYGNKLGVNSKNKTKSGNYFGRDESLPLDYDEYDDYIKGLKKDPNYNKSKKNIKRTEEEIIIQKKLKQDLKNRLGELMAIANTTKNELTRLMTISSPGILATIAAVALQVSALASGAPYTTAAVIPTLKAGLKSVKDLTNSILTEIDTIKGLGIQFMTGIYNLGNGPELNALFLPAVTMFDALDTIYSLFGGGVEGRSALQNCEEGESNKMRRIFEFDFSKSFNKYNPGADCEFAEKDITIKENGKDITYYAKDNTWIKLNDNKSLSFKGTLYYKKEKIFCQTKIDKDKVIKIERQNSIKIKTYNDDGTLKKAYEFKVVPVQSSVKKVEWTSETESTDINAPVDPETGKRPMVYTPQESYAVAFDIIDVNGNEKPSDFIFVGVKNIFNYREQETDLDLGYACEADVYIVNGNNIKINDKDFNEISYRKKCDKCYIMDKWDRKETKEYTFNNTIYYDKPTNEEKETGKIKGSSVFFDITGVKEIELVDNRTRTRITGGSIAKAKVASYSKLNIFGESVNIETDNKGDIIKEEACYTIKSLVAEGLNSIGVNDPPDPKNYHICDCRDPLKAFKDNTNFTENDDGERYYSFEVKDDARFLKLVDLKDIILQKIEIENFQDMEQKY